MFLMIMDASSSTPRRYGVYEHRCKFLSWRYHLGTVDYIASPDQTCLSSRWTTSIGILEASLYGSLTKVDQRHRLFLYVRPAQAPSLLLPMAHLTQVVWYILDFSAFVVTWRCFVFFLRRYLTRRSTILFNIPNLGLSRPEETRIKGTAIVCGGRCVLKICPASESIYITLR